MAAVMLADIAAASVEIAATPARSKKVARLVALLEAVDRADVPAVVAWLSGELLQRRVGVGWASLAAVPPPAESASLAIAEVNDAFAAMADMSGPGSQGERAARLHDVMSRATSAEQELLRALLTGNLRQGALAGVMTDAVAKAAGASVAEVRRALMLRGDLPAVAAAAMAGTLSAFTLEVGIALAPMLAQSAKTVHEAFADLGVTVAFEAKLDGARIQIHKLGADVRLFTRSLDDVTARLAHVAADVAKWPVDAIIADGEILWFAFAGNDEPARPLPFQETASKFASGAEEQAKIYLFDLLHLNAVDFIDRPNEERRAALEGISWENSTVKLVERLVTSSADDANGFFDRVVKSGFEGVVAKSLSAPYDAGRRGASWRKIKPVHTLDLVVLAVEQGSGRRTGKLSNIHLGARDPETGRFIMLGKTFKGMTDAMLEWQTQRFTELAVGSTTGYVVKLRPEQVVEIAFDGVQTSTRYPGGVALRFARVLRYRDDKTAAEADTIDAVRAFRAD